MEPTARTALVTGASGHVGGELVPRLLEEGWRVRVLSRSASSLADRPWAGRVEVVEGDAEDPATLARALDGVDVAYYLIHSMASGDDFAQRDRRLADAFSQAAGRAGVGRIVYLGGLHPHDEELSPHLASRVEVGQVLLDGPVPTAALQAAVVIGEGSISFQMLRYLSDRLPVMLAPKWLRNRIQPIAVADLLHFLVVAADLPPEVNQTFDVGGPEVLTYADMIHRFSEVAGLGQRRVVTVPVLTPGLASRWIGLVTPLDTQVARPLVDSLVHEVVCTDDPAHRLPPPPRGLVGFDEAVRAALVDAPPDRGLRNLALAAGATAVCAVVGSVATDPGSRWYRGLDLPAWQPPAAAFPVVWTALYADLALVSATAVNEAERAGEADQAAAYWRALGANLLL
ncbi:MAG: NAD(P)H-binding protein, partial [Nocardioides sp.]|nr:NAD(P)H-binding protein [Nocardioides sp.]